MWLWQCITEVYVCHTFFRLHLSHIRISSLAPPLRQRLGPAACSWQLPGVFDDEGDSVSARDAAAQEEGQEGAEGQVEEDHCGGHSVFSYTRLFLNMRFTMSGACDQCHQWRFSYSITVVLGKKEKRIGIPLLYYEANPYLLFTIFLWF